jgi:DegV family protein with EDD domain
VKIGVVVDSSSDLPSSYFKNGDVELMPTVITLGDHSFDDVRDERQTIQFHEDVLERMRKKSDIDASTAPYTSEKIEALFLSKLVSKYDQVFCIMASHARSDIYDHAFKASRAILTKYKPIRQAAGLDGHFSLSVVNSQNVFAGTAVIAAETVRMIKAGATPSEINKRIHEVVPHTYCYLVPPYLDHIYKRASQRGDKSISWLGFKVGSMLDIKPIMLARDDETKGIAKIRGYEPAVEIMFANATRAVEAGLMSPEIIVAYGGDPAGLPKLPGYSRFRDAATRAGYKLNITPMSISGSVLAGPGCAEVAFISEHHEFEERV